jgi:GDP-L-fucose synthase
MCAGRVGGIKANRDFPADFLCDNLLMQCNVINSCLEYGVKKLVFVGSSCIYPSQCPQPMKEEYLLTGPLEPTNEGYALAKISGIKLAQYCDGRQGLACVNPVPCNLYGPGDSFDLDNSHVLSALVKRFCDAAATRARSVKLWGTGFARREFLHVDDAARAIWLVFGKWNSPAMINVGSGADISIKELALLVAGKAGYGGVIEWDASMPDGMARKCLDVFRLKTLGFSPEISLERGVESLIGQYRRQKGEAA